MNQDAIWYGGIGFGPGDIVLQGTQHYTLFNTQQLLENIDIDIYDQVNNVW